MTLSWDAAGDFGEVVDTVETVTLQRRDGTPAGETTTAWRYAERTSDPASSAGAVRVVDTTWQLPIVAGGESPHLGDAIQDEAGVCGVVRSVTRMRGSTRWVCETRRAVLAPLRSEICVLERPIYSSGPQGDELSGWRLVKGGISAVILPIDADASGLTHRAYLGELALGQSGDRLRSPTGSTYVLAGDADLPALGDPLVLDLEASQVAA